MSDRSVWQPVASPELTHFYTASLKQCRTTGSIPTCLSGYNWGCWDVYAEQTHHCLLWLVVKLPNRTVPSESFTSCTLWSLLWHVTCSDAMGEDWCKFCTQSCVNSVWTVAQHRGKKSVLDEKLQHGSYLDFFCTHISCPCSEPNKAHLLVSKIALVRIGAPGPGFWESFVG